MPQNDNTFFIHKIHIDIMTFMKTKPSYNLQHSLLIRDVFIMTHRDILKLNTYIGKDPH